MQAHLSERPVLRRTAPGPSAPGTAATRAPFRIYPLIASTVFAGALLLFQVQPLIARYILPWFGGGPGVWTTCMLFFQVILLAGYAYAHLLQRLRPRRQAAVHVALLAASVALLPITPDVGWKPAAVGIPVLRILALLGASVGAQSFLLSTTGPLLQRWSTARSSAASPYPLYALSNAGSLLALLSYPFLVEPYLSRRTQAVAWSCGFGVYALLSLLCAAWVWRGGAGGSELRCAQPAGERGHSPGGAARSLWLLLPACGSVMLLAVTNQLCLDVAVIPFLWILPLSLYLLSFVLSFHSTRWYPRLVFLCLLQVGMVGEAWVLSLAERKQASVPLQIAVHSAVLFVSCMVCHGELVRLRPAPRRLTSFYLAIAAGGALGGAFVAGLAPLLFRSYFELHIGLVACLLLLLVVLFLDRDWMLYRGRPLWAWIPLGLLVVVLAATLWQRAHAFTRRADYVSRNFYGVLSVGTYDPDEPQARRLVLTHGTTLHGLQFVLPDKRRWPTTYYGPQSGVGLALRHYAARGPLRVGAVGLGVGTVAAYGRAGDTFRFYEINPEVKRVAQTRFSYLADSPAHIEIEIGDARLSLEREPPQGFDLIVLDAFSSDAIPVHLVTREAFEIYLRHLAPEGAIAVHISNAYLDLRPVVFGLADHFGLDRVLVSDVRGRKRSQDPREVASDALRGLESSYWVLVTRDRAWIDSEGLRQGVQPSESDVRRVRLWTDDASNLLQILRH